MLLHSSGASTENVGLRVAGVGVFAAPSASLSGGEPKTVRPQPPHILRCTDH